MPGVLLELRAAWPRAVMPECVKFRFARPAAIGRSRSHEGRPRRPRSDRESHVVQCAHGQEVQTGGASKGQSNLGAIKVPMSG